MQTSTANALRPRAEDAAAAWAALIQGTREQIHRLADEDGHGTEEFLAARLSSLRFGARASEELDYLRALARPDDVWIDIGAAAGRLAVPLAASVRTMIALDPSPTMRAAIEAAVAENGVPNLEVRDGRWPDDADAVPEVDVSLSANLLYDVERPLAFVEAMERRSRRLCVVTLADRPARSPNADVWREVMGEELVHGPGAADLIVLLAATGRRVDVRTFPGPAPRALPLDEAVEAQRWRCGLRADSPRLGQLREAVARLAGSDGSVRLPSGRRYTAVVSWEPTSA